LLKETKLEGKNQYECPKCEKKVDARLGEKFESLPPIMMCIVNRFDFDYV